MRAMELTSLAGELARIEALFETWNEAPRETVRAYRHAIDALHGEALRRLIRSLRDDSAAALVLREAAADDVVYAVLRHHGIVKPGIAERVEAALDSIRPMLASHGGDVELVRADPPVAAIRLSGACGHCPASTLTIDAAIRTAVRDACPEITDIVQVKDRVQRGEESSWLPAGTLSEIRDGGVLTATPGGRAVILARHGGEVTCFDDACAHLGAPLHDGIVEDGVLTCPWHGFRYDLRTGACETAPGIALAAHEVRVIGERVLVRLAG